MPDCWPPRSFGGGLALAQRLETYRQTLHDTVVTKDARLMQLGSQDYLDQMRFMRRGPFVPPLRSTLLWALLPAASIYGVALVWSAAEGISSAKVL